MSHGGFEHNTKRLAMAKVALLINLTVISICLILNYVAPQFRTQEDMFATDQATRAKMVSLVIAAAAFVISRLAAAMLFIRWLLRALSNTRHLHSGRDLATNTSTGLLQSKSKLPSNTWAALCWFIPLINLAAPYFVLKRLADTAHTEHTNERSRNVELWFVPYFLHSVPIGWLLLLVVIKVGIPIGPVWITTDILCPFIAVFFLFKVMNQITVAQERQFALAESRRTNAIAADDATKKDSGAVIRTDAQTPIAEPAKTRIEP